MTAMRCRWCPAPATVAIRSGLEWHPACDNCAGWWGPGRHGHLDEVEPGYVHEPPIFLDSRPSR